MNDDDPGAGARVEDWTVDDRVMELERQLQRLGARVTVAERVGMLERRADSFHDAMFDRDQKDHDRDRTAEDIRARMQNLQNEYGRLTSEVERQGASLDGRVRGAMQPYLTMLGGQAAAVMVWVALMTLLCLGEAAAIAWLWWRR